jgi:hypothetical protein
MFPSLIQNGYSEIIASGNFLYDVEGNPRLKPTIVEDYSGEYTRKFEQLFSTFKVGMFFEQSHDLIAPFINGPIVTINGVPAQSNYAQNVGDSHGWGGELQLKGDHPSGFRWDVSYSYAHVTDESDAAKAYLNYGGSAPKSHLRLLLGYSTGAWEFDQNTHYVSSTNLLRNVGAIQVTPVHTDGYLSVGARIGFRVNDTFVLSLSGTNLDRHVTKVSPYPAVERQIVLGLTGKF